MGSEGEAEQSEHRPAEAEPRSLRTRLVHRPREGRVCAEAELGVLCYAAAVSASLRQRNSVPSIHIRCMTTAKRRARGLLGNLLSFGLLPGDADIERWRVVAREGGTGCGTVRHGPASEGGTENGRSGDLALAQRSQVARGTERTRPVVAGGAIAHPLIAGGGVEACLCGAARGRAARAGRSVS
jgi:hypothetical protein